MWLYYVYSLSWEFYKSKYSFFLYVYYHDCVIISWSAMQHYFCRLASWNWFLICKKCQGLPEWLETSSQYSSIS